MSNMQIGLTQIVERLEIRNDYKTSKINHISFKDGKQLICENIDTAHFFQNEKFFKLPTGIYKIQLTLFFNTQARLVNNNIQRSTIQGNFIVKNGSTTITTNFKHATHEAVASSDKVDVIRRETVKLVSDAFKVENENDEVYFEINNLEDTILSSSADLIISRATLTIECLKRI